VTFCINFWIRRVVKFKIEKVKQTTIWNGGSTCEPNYATWRNWCLVSCKSRFPIVVKMSPSRLGVNNIIISSIWVGWSKLNIGNICIVKNGLTEIEIVLIFIKSKLIETVEINISNFGTNIFFKTLKFESDLWNPTIKFIKYWNSQFFHMILFIWTFYNQIRTFLVCFYVKDLVLWCAMTLAGSLWCN